jgi:nucleoside-diphosphate-sugar epimerase
VRCLITGGAGFIGSHLTEVLVSRGDDVAVLDNLSTGHAHNLADVQDHVRMVQGSVLDPLLVDELVEEADVVFHLAAAVGVKLVVERPLRSFLTNIRGSEIVLEAAHRHRKKVLLASTSEVYGKNNRVPFREEDDLILGSSGISRWGYAISKTADEILGFAYHRERDLPLVIVRLFNTVGPRQTGAYGMVLPRFVSQALAGEPLTVYGDGKQSRCLCHVSDVVDALLRLIDEPRAEGEAFNVGSTEEISILDLAQRVIEEAGSSSTVELVPYESVFPKGFEDMRRRVPDISKIRSLVEWQPTRSLGEIIRELADHAQLEDARVATDPRDVNGSWLGGER